MNLKKANSLFRSGDYKGALYAYRSLDYSDDKISKNIKLNIKLANKKLGKCDVDQSERCAIFAGYSSNNVVSDYVLFYLKKLKNICNYVVYVCDNPLSTEEKSKLINIADFVVCGKHGEYDFGSYKRGFFHLKENGILARSKQLIVCNDSCYGPISGFENLFTKMNKIGVDFWGLTSNTEFGHHIQSYFFVLNNDVFNSVAFLEFISSIKSEDTVQDVILNYEVKLTSCLVDAGFIWSDKLSGINGVSDLQKLNTNLTVFPIFMLENECELLKVKAVKKLSANSEGIHRTLNYIESKNQNLYAIIADHSEFDLSKSFEKIKFSIILASYNRVNKIENAINSVLIQNYLEYELIIIDDGSTDETSNLINNKYRDYLKSGKIKLITLDSNKGVAYARNQGLKVANNEWIAYLDSDNVLKFNFLSYFADAIWMSKSADLFYAAFLKKSDLSPFGKNFDIDAIRYENFIDLGVFVHNRSYINKCEFDEKLKRLVDWDFILQCINYNEPVYIPYSVMVYDDTADSVDRISIKESYAHSLTHIKNKHSINYKASAVVLAYNHENYLEEALESACQQIVDNLIYDVIVFDDASTDRTWEIVSKLALKYPNLIRGCKNTVNLGQAKNFRNAVGAARSDFIAILEGDDLWTDPEKVSKQVKFLISNPSASMVFSKISVLNSTLKTERALDRQLKITKKMLEVDDFLADDSMNLIGTFSTCMFRRYIIEEIPEYMFNNRLSEISVAFHSAKYGHIGYLDSVMTRYLQHDKGLWSGASDDDRSKMWVQTRIAVMSVAPLPCREKILMIIKNKILTLPMYLKEFYENELKLYFNNQP